MYRATGPEEARSFGETGFVNGIAAASASGASGPTRACAGIIGFAALSLGARVAVRGAPCNGAGEVPKRPHPYGLAACVAVAVHLLTPPPGSSKIRASSKGRGISRHAVSFSMDEPTRPDCGSSGRSRGPCRT
ncbi:hypothetical protein ACLF3G_23850 [Falsiroseomonas sp. HC035]|uniref:hypothetical protein n=1 Tax=Falsiroseomonas sp. HC035 TaxID=3390999 RepID=UPI003D322A85